MDIYFDCQKSRCGVTGDDCLVFPAILLLYLLSIFYCCVEWEIIFQNWPQIHLLMSFNSIRIMAGYGLCLPKIKMCSDWWWLLGVSIQTIAIFTFNMLLLNGKSFFRSKKDHKFTYLWASIALELCLDAYFDCQKSRCGVTDDGCLVFPAKPLLYAL